MASNSFLESLILLWKEWELQLLVLLSLILQIILIGLGNRRKYSSGNKIAFVLWLTYLCADSIATVSLGILSRNQGKCSDSSVDLEYVIKAFWAPFLLLHLGGPDTITAYSPEDNELWHRHLLGLIVEVAVAIYIFVRSMKPTQLNFLAIPILVAGLIKYGERTWSLRSASSKQFRRSLLPRPEPGLKTVKLVEHFICDGEVREVSPEITGDGEVSEAGESDGEVREAGESDGEVREVSREITGESDGGGDEGPLNSDLNKEVDALIAAYKLFSISKHLFADLMLKDESLKRTRTFFQSIRYKNAFKVVEMELGFMFDVLFTKATIVHHFWGGVLRSISFSSTAAALTAFCLIDLSGYSSANVVTSLILLVGAIGLELYAIFGLLSSDWTMIWMGRHDNLQAAMRGLISRVLSLSIDKRWSNHVGQCNMLSSCLEDRRVRCCGLLNWIHEQLEDYQDDQMQPVSDYLKESVFKQLLEKSEETDDFKRRKELCSYRGEGVLKKYEDLDLEGLEHLRHCINVEFDQSIILWHIATDICLNCDDGGNQDPDTARRDAIRVISNYMLFLLMKRPLMLPDGIGQLRLQDTRAEAEDWLQDRECELQKSVAYKRLLEVGNYYRPWGGGEFYSKSVLYDACRLAASLQSLETGNLTKWEVMIEVWVEMLCYAACHCRWNHHARQLGRGGELLTHVWILMAHLGISDRFNLPVLSNHLFFGGIREEEGRSLVHEREDIPNRSSRLRNLSMKGKIYQTGASLARNCLRCIPDFRRST